MSARVVEAWDGSRIDLMRVPPAAVVKLAKRDAERMLMLAVSKSKAYEGGVGVPDLHEAKRVVDAGFKKPTDDWGPVEAGAARSLLINTQWPQRRLFESGLADSELCCACGTLPGTLQHRGHECDATTIERQHLAVGGDLYGMKAKGFQSKSFCERGLAPSLHHLLEPPRRDVVVVVQKRCEGERSAAMSLQMGQAPTQNVATETEQGLVR